MSGSPWRGRNAVLLAWWLSQPHQLLARGELEDQRIPECRQSVLEQVGMSSNGVLGAFVEHPGAVRGADPVSAGSAGANQTALLQEMERDHEYCPRLGLMQKWLNIPLGGCKCPVGAWRRKDAARTGALHPPGMKATSLMPFPWLGGS